MAAIGKLAQYRQLLINLLPLGRLWQPAEQPVFSDLLESSAQELCRVDERVTQMLEVEIDPRTALEALDQWEAILGLPDECSPLIQTVDERRQQATQKLTNIGGLSETFYEFIAAQLGFPDVTVNNFVNFIAGRARAGDPLTNYFDSHFVAGSTAGTALTDIGWLYYFNVDIPTPSDTIECTMRKLKPAHGAIFFT